MASKTLPKGPFRVPGFRIFPISEYFQRKGRELFESETQLRTVTHSVCACSWFWSRQLTCLVVKRFYLQRDQKCIYRTPVAPKLFTFIKNSSQKMYASQQVN